MNVDFAKDWLDKFRETFEQHAEEDVAAYVGRRISLAKVPPGEEEPVLIATVNVIGYGHRKIMVEDQEAHQWTFLSDEGKELPLFVGLFLSDDETVST